jgi:YfiH family protein
LKQVHGVRVVDADDLSVFASNLSPPEADASVTTCPERVLAVLTADCLSVVLSDERGSVLGAAHAGWKGLAAGVLEETLALMRRKQPKGSGWRAWIGPGIGAASFQVGADVLDAFSSELSAHPALYSTDPSAAERWRLDLAGLAQVRLEKMGVTEIEQSKCCTVTNPKHFFSYRRDRQTGRMATVAWLIPSPLEYTSSY